MDSRELEEISIYLKVTPPLISQKDHDTPLLLCAELRLRNPSFPTTNKMAVYEGPRGRRWSLPSLIMAAYDRERFAYFNKFELGYIKVGVKTGCYEGGC